MAATTLSVDVGVRTMAICVMSVDATTRCFDVLLWDVYDTLSDPDAPESHRCEAVVKSTGRICDKVASMHDDANDRWVCGTHRGTSRGTTSRETIRGTTSRGTSRGTSQGTSQGTTTGRRDRPVRVKDLGAQELVAKVLQTLQRVRRDFSDAFDRVTSVHVELQPGKNPTMKLVSHVVFGYLVQVYVDRPQVPLRFVRAADKLKAYTGPVVRCDHIKNAYARRKWLAVRYVTWFLKDSERFSDEQRDALLPAFEARRKADDLADCMLQAVNALVGVPKSRNKNGSCVK